MDIFESHSFGFEARVTLFHKSKLRIVRKLASPELDETQGAFLDLFVTVL